MTAASSRLGLCLLAAAFLLSASACAHSNAPPVHGEVEDLNDGIAVSSMRSEGLDETMIREGIEAIRRGAYGNIHSLLIFRHGRLVSESYFPGEDEDNHNGSIGFVLHSRDTLHDMRSVSKTVVALALLLAHEQGYIRSLDQPIFDYFPEYAQRHANSGKEQITIRHALTMTAGLDWNEDVPFSHPDSSPAQLGDAPDPIDFVLGRRLVAPPGGIFTYNGGLTQILAAIIHRSTGRNVEEFTREHLFSPLGIQGLEWAKRRDGEPDADSGLRLRSRDMAKIGLLLANRGNWAGRQILSSRLVEEAVSEHVDIPQQGEAAALGDRQGYGYQIWRFSFLAGEERIDLTELSGNGGQKVYMDEANQLMVVITAGNYDRRGLPKSPFDVYAEIVLPAVMGR